MTRRAVIDVGSNSVLLTVAEGPPWTPIFETSEVTALGEGTKATGLLGEQGMTNTLAAIGRAFAKARELGAEPIVAAATMAARIATNTNEFIQRADAQGTPVRVLSGEDEAELGFRSVVEDQTLFKTAPNRISIIDVGGQSTELVTADRDGENWTIRYRKSFAVGTLGLRGSILSDESPDGLALLRASQHIDDLIGLAYRPEQAGYAIALGATGTNLITIRDRMADWDPDKVHGQWLDFEEVSKAVGWMSAMTDAKRAAIVGIEPGRERTIHIGSLILERFLQSLHVLGCGVNVHGWRHALLNRL